MQAFGGLLLEKTSEGGLRSVFRGWSVMAYGNVWVAIDVVFIKSETATVLAAVWEVYLDLLLLFYYYYYYFFFFFIIIFFCTE